MDARELADALIRRFVDVAITTYLGSIDELATGFGVAPDVVTDAIGMLVESGDFTCDPHPATVDPATEVTLSIDWDRFAEVEYARLAAEEEGGEEMDELDFLGYEEGYEPAGGYM